MNLEEIKKNVSDFLNYLISQLQFSQEELAATMGIKQGRLSKYLNNKELPNAEFIINLARKANVTVDEIYSFNKDTSKKPQINVEGFINIVGNNNNVAGRDIFINSSIKKRFEFTPTEDHISSTQSSKLKTIVDDIVELEKKTRQKPKSHQAIWSAFNRHMGVTYYRETPRDQFNKAEAYLMKWKGRLQSQKKFINSETDDWRKKRFSAIYARAKSKLSWGKEDVQNYILGKYGVDSLKHLSNDDLEKVYKYFFGK